MIYTSLEILPEMNERILRLNAKMMHKKKSETLRAILLKGIIELEKEYGIEESR